MSTPIAHKSEIEEGTTKRVEIDGQSVLLCNVEGEIYAIEDVCTHDGGALDQGELMGDRIMCPRHGAFFDVKSGDALTLPAILPVQTFKVTTQGDDIFVEFPEKTEEAS
jgi:3-phenylpropionate/trans-cinnamate dioxygenase ferredoxin subunit